MDIGLPDESGLSLLERMKSDPLVRHIPIHMISAYNHAQVALELGAIGYVLKPAQRNDLVQAINKIEEKLSKRIAKVLVIEDDATLRDNISLLLKAEDVEIVAVGTVHEALEQVKSTTIDCIVLDLMLPDMPGYVFLEQMAETKAGSVPPVIVYTGRALTKDEEHKLRRYSTSIIVKGARSPERLLDEVTLFLHRVESALPEGQQDLLRRARSRDSIFEDKTILLAEDDVRNIFALSKVLEPLGVKLELARNGREALDRLAKDNAIDIVLMDIMMPEMDGLTAIRAIRNELGLKKLPIIAITAKAMPNDRQECLTAGANDYIAKPVDIDKLISLCKVWMPK
jgi:CheY-like chemotaxis protein